MTRHLAPGTTATETANSPSPPTLRPAARLGAAVRAAAPWTLLAVSVLFAVTHMDQGIDTWISLAGGRDVVAHGVRDADPFSFQSRPPHPAADGGLARLGGWLQPGGWINQNWLTHALFFGLYRLGGLDALVIWKIANYALVAAVIVAAARVLGSGWTWAALAAAAALAAGRDYLSMRAQDVTNLMLAVLLLVLALAERHGRRFLWALVPLFAVWANAHGGYVVGFIVLAVVIAREWRQSRTAPPSSAGGARPLMPLLAAGGAALLIAAAASPYRLANLTHPLVISVSPDAPQWRVVREWQPLLSNPVASPYPFLAFAACAILALVGYYRQNAGGRTDHAVAGGAWIAIATFALAVTSGRFVPVACIAAAPFLAIWLERSAAFLVAPAAGAVRRRLARNGAAFALGVAAAAAAVAFFPRAARTFFGPWSQSAQRTGLFDRMTFSHQRPWEACAFLTANGVSGRMWNFWDEGGFMAFCQQPDRDTGKPPVELFIDGRAQAAYDVEALVSYLDLLNGNLPAQPAGEEPRADGGLEALRAWTKARLDELGVSFALVPAARQNTALARAVVGMQGWKLVYVDPEHSLFADTGNPHGRALAEAVAAGTARFPDQASAKLTAAFRLLPPAGEEDQRRAVQLAREAYQQSPTLLAVLCATRAARAPEVRKEALRFCREVAEGFIAERETLRGRHGYAPRLEAAMHALNLLGADATAARNQKLAVWAASWQEIFTAEDAALAREALW